MIGNRHNSVVAGVCISKCFISTSCSHVCTGGIVERFRLQLSGNQLPEYFNRVLTTGPVSIAIYVAECNMPFAGWPEAARDDVTHRLVSIKGGLVAHIAQPTTALAIAITLALDFTRFYPFLQ
jgi:hypothetical protein